MSVVPPPTIAGISPPIVVAAPSLSFTRVSLFRYLIGEAAKRDHCYLDLRPSFNGESNHIAANGKFIAYACQGPGGPLTVLSKNQTGRVSLQPVINVHREPGIYNSIPSPLCRALYLMIVCVEINSVGFCISSIY
jgi:hypothetical protein